ncbi:O-methyltransferase [Hibiscus syriacus]|uniref:O-methyltransferase n=1 Tax=Hibiscus syriacus TaxID=106335 RepID=A0A6A2WYQ7_HIBSY|nr:O-methyltransferase [Hibiscus syriacus]
MRLLVRRKIFTIHHPSDCGDPVYDLTHSSRWLLHDSEQTLAPMILIENHPLLLAPWHCLSQCVQEGGVAFKKAHASRANLVWYKEGLSSIGSLVDVGGGTGSLISEIVKVYPPIKGVNFDLQQSSRRRYHTMGSAILPATCYMPFRMLMRGRFSQNWTRIRDHCVETSIAVKFGGQRPPEMQATAGTGLPTEP